MNKFEAITEALKGTGYIYKGGDSWCVQHPKTKWSIEELLEEGWSVEADKPVEGKKCGTCGHLGAIKSSDTEPPYTEKFDIYCWEKGLHTKLSGYCSKWEKEKVKVPEVPPKMVYDTIDREILNGLIDCVKYLMEKE